MTARRSRYLLAASLAALSAATLPLGAQGGAGGAVIARTASPTLASQNHIAIPAQTVKALIAAHHADLANGTSDATILTLMIDSNGNYIGSAATKPTMVARALAPTAGSVAPAAAPAGGSGGVIVAASVASANPSAAGEPQKMTFSGIGSVDASLVQDLFWTNYEAGEVSPGALRVRFVVLKNAPPK